MPDTITSLKEILADLFIKQDSDLTEETNLREDLGADSLDEIETIMEIEEHFDIVIPDGRAETCKTVADLVIMIDELKVSQHG